MIRFCIFCRFSRLTVALQVGAFALGFLIVPPASAQVTKTTSYTYDEDNLLPLTITETGTNMPTRVTAYTYAHDIPEYADMKARNMLVQVAREDVYEPASNYNIYYKSTVTTWQNYLGNVRWRPHRQFEWQAAGVTINRPSFSHWQPNQSPPGWVRTAEIKSYHHVNARPTEIIDVHGARTLLYYGDNGNPLSNTATGFRHAHLTGIRRIQGSSDSPVDTLTHTAKYALGRSSPIEITDASGSTTSFTYDGLGRLTTVRNNAGAKVASYAYRIAGADIGAEPNYVQTRLFGQNDNSYVESTQFIDGLGRPIQTIERGSRSSDKEIVAAQRYDDLGRPTSTWKPYERGRSSAVVPTYDADFSTHVKQYYSGTAGYNYSFVWTRYQSNPLNRVRAVIPEGFPFETQGTRYRYRVETIGGITGHYVETRDGDGNYSASVTDAFGREVIRGMNGSDTQIGAMTRFQYDLLDRLLKTTDPNGAATTYTYDTRGNLLQATSPDAGTVRYRYDAGGRVRFSRDARQHAANRVAFTRYDTYSRPVRSGVASGVTLSTFNSLNTASTHAFENTQSNWHSVWHYDNQAPRNDFPWNLFASNQYSGFTTVSAKGRLTARAYKSDGVWQVELYRYDGDGRITAKRILTEDLPTRQTNYTYVYDRQGRLLERANQVGSFNAWNYYDYDSYGRLEKIFMKTTYPGKPASPEVTYTYNAAGQKTSERFRGSSALPITYTIRGQVHDIGAPRNASYPHPFSARYAYTTGGNVSVAEFYQKQSPHAYKGYRYAFEYDGFNRMTAADFSRWSSGSSFIGSSYFDVSNITYDDAGNIITLRRRGGASTAIADNLTYIYSGFNRLTGITDAAGANQGWDSGTMSFQYDASGNMTRIQDVSRGTDWDLNYDESNRVMSIYEPGMTAFRYRYRYNADGQRYHKQAVPYKSAPGPAQYYALDGNATVGVFSATGGGTWNIFTPTGEAIGRMTTSGAASYYIKDHLGSVRVVVNSSGTVLETRDYYPFGLEMPGRSYLSGTKAKENFTGHERDAETGMLYAGARYYMPNIGRWTRVDPALTVWDVDRLMHHQAFSWSPYVYVKNDPIGRFDPDGFTDWPALAKGSVKLAGGLFMTVGGYKTMAAGGVTVAASGGGSAPVSVPMMLGGKALATFGLTQVGFGLAEISSAWLTPDGMSAATYRNIAGIVAEQFADETTAEAVNLTANWLAGGKDIGKNMVLDRVVPALLDAATLADDLMGLLRAYEAEHLTNEDTDNEYRTDTRTRQ